MTFEYECHASNNIIMFSDQKANQPASSCYCWLVGILCIVIIRVVVVVVVVIAVFHCIPGTCLRKYIIAKAQKEKKSF
ncbi:hypothetical protein DERF_001171 [Dermatophagoides farinae]|uniref:Transmembrane protein n=1 Tax=Dermatophagoides farinae TaxID=6954 RepID=A0A922IBQ4_DERFA|nr:hypothetical protein DERF_001171 [Dermatophagoides farinae]